MKGEPQDPAAEIQTNGFVFSIAQLQQTVTRNLRLQEAKFYQKHAWNSRAPFKKPLLTMPQLLPLSE
jgi:hypothetical protein